jgi:ribosomal protein L11 methyltransferase
MAEQESFWWYLTLRGGVEVPADALCSIAELTGSVGSELTESSDAVHLRAYYRTSRDLAWWVARVGEALESWPGVKIEDTGKIENQRWSTDFREAFPPLPVGRGLVVLAPWWKGEEPQGRIPLYVYPGTAFGTGYHESTRIALSLLEDRVRPGCSGLDVGTGSGILSIAMVKLGASRVFARDLDPAVLEEVRRNMGENGLSEGRIDLAAADLLEGFDERVDLLVANILLDPLRSMLPLVPSALAPGGVGIFSGMICSERSRFLEALAAAGLRPLEERDEGDWWGVAAQAEA